MITSNHDGKEDDYSDGSGGIHAVPDAGTGNANKDRGCTNKNDKELHMGR